MGVQIFLGYSKQLTWLLRLRWAAVVGQLVLLFISYKLLDLTLPFANLLSLIGVVAITNLGIQLYKVFFDRIAKIIIGATLLFDSLILTLLLYFSGGPANPFSIVYLVHVSVAALLLGSNWTWVMVILSTICFSLLFNFHLTVPQLSMHMHDTHAAFSVHLYGMLLAFALVAVLTGFFLTKMSEALTMQEREIADLRLIAANQERLTSLTTLAAGAAHELGSPLSTIALATAELKAALERSSTTPSMLDDAKLIQDQIARCKLIIANMSGQAGELMGEMPQTLEQNELCSAIKHELGDSIADKVVFKLRTASAIHAPKWALSRALATLIRNSVEACKDNNAIQVIIDQMGKWIDISVIDAGEGIPKDILPRVGDPFFTTKEAGKGMGLGVFLVKLFAQRIGGSLEIKSEVGKGTCAILRIPQEMAL